MNGSVGSFDSFLSLFLTAGEYTIAVGTFNTTLGDINTGLNTNSPVYGTGSGFPTSGDYRLDIFGDVSYGMAVVPLPPAAWAGLGLLGAKRRLSR